MDLRAATDLGYIFHPSTHPSDIGYPRLDVLIREEPTDRHYDPETLEIQVVSDTGSRDMLSIYHPWPGENTYRLFPGRVLLRDRRDKVVESFTFGAELEIGSDPDVGLTVCIIRSSAPILDLSGENSLAILLAEEVEILLAKLRASHANNLEESERRLALLDPARFYLACLYSLRERFEDFHQIEMSDLQRLDHFIRAEIRVLQASSKASDLQESLEDLA